MNPDIVNALITSGGGIIVCLIGIFVGKKGENGSKRIKEMQLEKAFSPLDKLFFFPNSIEERIDEALKVMNEHYSLVPAVLWKEMKVIQKQQANTEYQPDLKRFRAICATYYEWTRKSLGYPYNKERIVWKFTPGYEKSRNRITILAIIYSVVWFVTFFILVAINAGKLNPPSIVTQIITYNTVFGVCILSMRLLTIWKRL